MTQEPQDDQSRPISRWAPPSDVPPAGQSSPDDLVDDERDTAEVPLPGMPRPAVAPVPAADTAPLPPLVPPPPPGGSLPGFDAPPASPPPSSPTRTDSSPRRRIPGPIWALAAAVAFLLGVLGGYAGGVLEDQDDMSSLAGGGLDPGSIETDAPLEGDDASIVKVAATLLPSTVQIFAEYQGVEDAATGSGFVFDRNGHVVTNNHVVADAAKAKGSIEVVDHKGRRYKADVIGRSAVYDLAVLNVPEVKELEPASLGSTSRLRIGEGVVAIGSPLGLSSTVTSGIVSALQRPVSTGQTEDDTSYINAVQTDAAINPGNSGGPLVNLVGQVIGVNSAIATAGGGEGGEGGSIGVGFAIPIDQVKVTAAQILKTGKATYPIVGASVDVQAVDHNGALISVVEAGSPAAAGGLKDGDRVTKVGDVTVTDGIGMIVAIRAHQPGETVEFTVMRNGARHELKIKLEAQTENLA
ncbi:trypsin-like peptidase domain-containing protein [Nocardioides sp. NPDC127503]|uniref:S1C family serine protease n=1 Tax=Nocardioides sp. NPDC127503 TaxID=3154516 RepID=UPI00332E5E68